MRVKLQNKNLVKPITGWGRWSRAFRPCSPFRVVRNAIDRLADSTQMSREEEDEHYSKK